MFRKLFYREQDADADPVHGRFGGVPSRKRSIAYRLYVCGAVGTGVAELATLATLATGAGGICPLCVACSDEILSGMPRRLAGALEDMLLMRWWWVILVKRIVGIGILGAGMVLGREGSTVELGAILAVW
ncbi:MAG: H(+)/Cl(-) exchange transporter ClcA [Sodalis sp.]|nr:MAG: H(+)/Cl(-) exchange transporter ClcA [Sodalis sp.]